MLLTPNIERAIRVAAILHDGQKRKGEGKPPYVTHPFSVAVILSEYTTDENTIIGGLLHDTIEDTSYIKQEMINDFGEKVAEIVCGVSEEQIRDGKKLSWKERKNSYIERLKKAPNESLMVAAADKIHNLSSILREQENAEQLFSSNPITAKDYLWFYEEVFTILKEGLDNDIIKKFEKVYGDAKTVFE